MARRGGIQRRARQGRANVTAGLPCRELAVGPLHRATANTLSTVVDTRIIQYPSGIRRAGTELAASWLILSFAARNPQFSGA